MFVENKNYYHHISNSYLEFDITRRVEQMVIISTLQMSSYSNVTQQDKITLRNLAQEQKNQRALKMNNRILKQTHDIKLAESLSPITEKLDTINQSTKQ